MAIRVKYDHVGFRSKFLMKISERGRIVSQKHIESLLRQKTLVLIVILVLKWSTVRCLREPSKYRTARTAGLPVECRYLAVHHVHNKGNGFITSHMFYVHGSCSGHSRTLVLRVASRSPTS